jgi:hypothetical protein
MFFLLSKSVSFLLLPSNILIGLAIVGVVLLTTGKKRAGTGLLLASIILLAIAGWYPTGNLLVHALESAFHDGVQTAACRTALSRIGRRDWVPVVA